MKLLVGGLRFIKEAWDEVTALSFKNELNT